MVQTAVHTVDIKALEQILQKRLYSEPLQIVPLQVRCWLKEKTLIILVQHPEPVMPYPRRAFRLLRQMLQDEQIAGNYEILMYLRVQNQDKPYAFHNLSSKVAENTHSELLADFDDDEESTYNEGLEAVNSINDDDIADFEAINWEQVEPDSGLDAEDLTPEVPLTATPVAKTPWRRGVLVVAGLAIIGFLGTVYGLSRPCVIGSCPAIPEAQQLAQNSLKISEKQLSGQEIFAVQKQLNEALKLLETVPKWSVNYPEAQKLITVYEGRAKALDEIVTALKSASRAGTMSQKPPYSVSEWEKIQKTWRDALSGLEKVPPDSEFYLFAQQKLKSYNQNLAVINQRLAQEQKAQASLEAGKQAAKIAEVRQGVAQSLDNWELVYSTWASAFQRFREIPKTTTAYPEAQQLIGEYTEKMTVASNRKNKEQFAYNAYQQALKLATLAKSAETQNQWSVAVFNWRNALNYIKQVPSDSFQYPQVEPLVNSYTTALQNAEGQLKLVVKLQQAQRDLDQVCQGSPQVCSYTAEQNVIKVRLTSTYMQKVRQTAIKAQAEANDNTQVQLLDHIATLEQALEAVSTNSSVRLEVYDAQGVLLMTYAPDKS